MPVLLILLLLLTSGTGIAVENSAPGEPLYNIRSHLNDSIDTLLPGFSKFSSNTNLEDNIKKNLQEEVDALNTDDTGTKTKNIDLKSIDDQIIKASKGLRVRSRDDDEGESEGDDNEGGDYFPGGGPSVIPANPNPLINANNTFTLADVAKHNSAQSCYSVVSGGVYDLTSWIAQHPGGKSAIIGMCGVDATNAFISQHGGQGRPEQELASFKIGTLR